MWNIMTPVIVLIMVFFKEEINPKTTKLVCGNLFRKGIFTCNKSPQSILVMIN